ncbi:hypothetical protein NPX13_g6813 [Xylaria arbuscula]|uniref:Uncharacterized protein n=1 Tax=Xylaria arbuscula TaxID=114810 RepID=A0A9W8NBN1_9PEZI|nr:hypothetical protein NPX13_g6813 [Xylaria arbuscula]
MRICMGRGAILPFCAGEEAIGSAARVAHGDKRKQGFCSSECSVESGQGHTKATGAGSLRQVVAGRQSSPCLNAAPPFHSLELPSRLGSARLETDAEHTLQLRLCPSVTSAPILSVTHPADRTTLPSAEMQIAPRRRTFPPVVRVWTE